MRFIRIESIFFNLTFNAMQWHASQIIALEIQKIFFELDIPPSMLSSFIELKYIQTFSIVWR